MMEKPHEEVLIGGGMPAHPSREGQTRLRQQSAEAVRRAEVQGGAKRVLRVVIADDQDLVRSGFRLILSSYENLVVVGEASDGRQAVECVRKTQPDVVLMDIRMPVENGIEATREITEDPTLRATRVLILTTFDIDEYVYDALSAGASGFMLKDSEPDEIFRAIEIVAAGDALIEPSITRRLVETFVKSRPNRRLSTGVLGSLTEREREILGMVARGLTNGEIASKLFISPATVKTHTARIMAKLGAHDRAQLVVLAYENGLVIAGS
ncbi:MAG: response regulator transcription factor [Raoultibacter sp.]